ncbi:PucR family transcriptional regulator [Vagococcus fluvialis]|uniref:PucR family transcriptional regulator n=1 Tax=Vagococcus fluvialis TaxID=2738 RepID=UPI001D09E47E|nr:PucR family transcriptional regulator ligand-binding domain-containing protein [Vagococcus fluvialis]UDM79137.1 PucR family transcriptional regulator ligand-binding domain-containing protein [Vagococcus fluvialis]
MKVEDFLQLPKFQDFKLLAGNSGVTNQITGVNILDNPNALDWLSPGELIVTSGYFFKDSPKALKSFIEGFKRLNIAALCIKPQIYLNPLPKELVTLCNKLGIPLIEIPYGVAFSKILNTVMNLLAETSHETNQMALETTSKFLEYGLKADGLDYLKEKLEELLDQPIIITNAEWTLVTKNFDSLFEDFLLSTSNHLSFNLNCLSVVPRKVDELKHPVTVTFKNKTNGMILPIFFNEVTYGYIIVLQKNKPLAQKDYVVLEQATITFALEMVHQAEKLHINNKKLRDFYRKLLFSFSSIEELRSFDIDFNFDIAYSIFIIDLNQITYSKDNILQQKHEEDLIFQNILSLSSNYKKIANTELHLFKQGKQFIGFLGQKNLVPKSNNNEQERIFKDYYHYLEASLKNKFKLTMFVGSIKEVNQLNESYAEAKQLLDFKNTQEGSLVFSNHYYVNNFLRKFIPTNEAANFTTYFLDPLIQYDQKNDSNLMLTLTAYLDNHQNLATTSRQLFIHRNTLLYRVEKIESLLGYSLNEKNAQFNLSLAIKLQTSFEQRNDTNEN